ncbi:APC family permease [Pedobacter sp. SYSU D00535]|uniref:APC family permease n=1 Tax=Pedobacter sp. SYSU D00535 TaxID=2810308 RepID=UPI001A96CFB3|nr:amino acid permease [Pedobacter sp. SYSU D00535]
MTEDSKAKAFAEAVDSLPIEPKKKLGLTDAIALIIGIVIGAGIFRTPSLVAANSADETVFFSVWIAGGVISLIGALCYAELTTAFPNTGGDYHFISKAYGKDPAFFFAWARIAIIQTGSIALLAFIFGDYASQVFNIGTYSSIAYAALAIILLTLINVLGVQFGSGTQKLLTSLEVAGLLLVTVAGLFYADTSTQAQGVSGATTENSIGMAMVVVLLTFGGWNEAAYLSSEMKAGSKQMVWALIIGIIAITIIYLLINVAYVNSLGLAAMAKSEAVGTEVMRGSFGNRGALLLGVLVAVSALTSANATIFTGARTNYAVGRDFKAFSWLGNWNYQNSTPVNAFLIQGIISLALVSLGFFTRDGFETIVEYTAPVFWFFFLLVGLSVFVLRRKEPGRERPFKVPLYPLTPLIFCLTSAYLLYSSIVYTGLGALVGLAVLLAGLPVYYLFLKQRESKEKPNHLPDK